MPTLAIGSERIANILGYALKGVDLSNNTPNLPMRIALIGEGNTANQGTMPTTPTPLTSAAQAGNSWGFGCPIHMAARILKPVLGDGVGGIPVIVYPVAEAGGAAARVQTITVTGTATASGTHTVVVGGRNSVDGESYSFNFSAGATAAQVATAINNAIAGVTGSPVSSTVSSAVVTATTKFAGITAQGINISIDNGGSGSGLTYAIAETTAGTGTPSITTAALDQFGNEWNTIVINTWDINTASIITELEAFNGKPSPTAPTGRYRGTIFRPFIALTGSVGTNDSAITSAKKEEVTIALCPAPNSPATPLEAAANYCVVFARQAQDTPHLDVQKRSLPDMPVTTTGLGGMQNYDTRDQLVKQGHSTVDLNAGVYRIQDFVTTYHPDGEQTPSFRYVRSLIQDFNIHFGYRLLEEIHVENHAIAADNDFVEAPNVIKPKQWTGILFGFADNLASKAIIADAAFMKANITVSIGTNNPDRFESVFRYKRSSFARVVPTVGEAGFNLG